MVPSRSASAAEDQPPSRRTSLAETGFQAAIRSECPSSPLFADEVHARINA